VSGSEQRTGEPQAGPPRRTRVVRQWWYVLLLAPFAATLVPPVFAREQPSIGGWPFFYWWQFAWVVITALIVALVYRVTTRREPRVSAVDPIDHPTTRVDPTRTHGQPPANPSHPPANPPKPPAHPGDTSAGPPNPS